MKNNGYKPFYFNIFYLYNVILNTVLQYSNKLPIVTRKASKIK